MQCVADKISQHHGSISNYGSTKRSINVQIAASLEIIALPLICGDNLVTIFTSCLQLH